MVCKAQQDLQARVVFFFIIPLIVELCLVNAQEIFEVCFNPTLEARLSSRAPFKRSVSLLRVTQRELRLPY